MKTSVSQFEVKLREWTDGPKRVVVHTQNHYPIIKKAAELGIEVMISAIDLTVHYIEHLPKNAIGSIFVVVDEADVQVAQQAANDRSDLSIQVFSI